MLPITLGYAGTLGLLMAILSIRVPIRRGVLDMPLGDGGDQALATRIRAFGNFIEYVPMLLLLLGLLEHGGAGSWLLHGLGSTLVVMRVLHAVAYVAAPRLTLPQKIGRGLSAMGTWLVLCIASGTALWLCLGAG